MAKTNVEKITNYLKDNPEKTIHEIGDALAQTKIGRKKIRDSVYNAKQTGKLIKSAEGKYSVAPTSVTPATKTDTPKVIDASDEDLKPFNSDLTLQSAVEELPPHAVTALQGIEKLTTDRQIVIAALREIESVVNRTLAKLL